MKVMIYDASRCNGCYNCQIACKDEHADNDWSPYAKPQPDQGHFWMRLEEVERGRCPKVKIAYIARPCMHCQDPPCIKASSGGAVYKRSDGIVVIDPEKSKGQKGIVEACPYGSVYWNEALNIPQKCHFCSHLLDRGWKEPRCVEACPVGALTFGEYDDLKGLIEEKGAETLRPELGTRPSVFYANLPKRFVAGAVFDADTREPLERAEVTLLNTATRATLVTLCDNYGDFEFEGLEPRREYELSVRKEGYQPLAAPSVKTERDVYLGQMLLTPKS